MPSVFKIVHVAISESQLSVSICCYVVQNSKHQKQNTGWAVIGSLTVYLIVRSLGVESQQNVFSFKLLCCHHSNHYISRTLDLRSLLLREYCSKQISFARGSTSCHPSNHTYRYTQTHTHTHTHTHLHKHTHTLTQTSTHYTFCFQIQLFRHTITKNRTLH